MFNDNNELIGEYFARLISEFNGDEGTVTVDGVQYMLTTDYRWVRADLSHDEAYQDFYNNVKK